MGSGLVLRQEMPPRCGAWGEFRNTAACNKPPARPPPPRHRLQLPLRLDHPPRRPARFASGGEEDARGYDCQSLLAVTLWFNLPYVIIFSARSSSSSMLNGFNRTP